MSFINRPYHNEKDPLFIAITKDIGYLGKIKNTRFGDLLIQPDINEFFKFAKIKAFRTGHWAYNHFHFSTQVPMRIHYLCSQVVEFEYPYWNKTASLAQASDLSIFDNFTELEYIFIDCFLNHKNIMSDGYFKNDEDLLRGIAKQMRRVSLSFPIDQEKIWKTVQEKCPNLIKYKE